MANIKSAKKRAKVAEKSRLQNNAQKSEIKTQMKKFKKAVESCEFDLATELLRVVTGLLDNGAQDGVMHKNKADRNKSKLSKMLHDAQNKKA